MVSRDRDRLPPRGRDRAGDRRGRPDRDRVDRDRPHRERLDRERLDRDRAEQERLERARADRARTDRPARPIGRGERAESLERIEQRPRFEPHPPEWGRPEFVPGQRVAWNFVYKLANTGATRGTITRVGETCDIRWDDGLETLFLPPVVLQAAQDGEEAGPSGETTTAAGPGEPPADEGAC